MVTNEELGQRRPAHLALGMLAVNQYTMVETQVSVLLTDMASADPLPIAAVYGELRQGHIQAKALRAVAKVVLVQDDLDLLTRLMKVIKSASDGRDQLAHRMWMYDDQLPLDVILVDPAVVWTTSHLSRIAGGPGPVQMEDAEGIQRTLAEGCRIWSMQELEALRIQAVRCVVGLQAFSLMLKAGTPEVRAGERQKVVNILVMAGS
ncbi:hypothetical protein V8J38_14060 [Brevundimonas olei]|uniref:Uncharacterized protein n=1 Tax=Brevundimonas olei TaxID=657642 RepID=A0ABZ2IEB7_9CAUL